MRRPGLELCEVGASRGDLDFGFGHLFCGIRGPTLNSLSPKPGEHDVAGSHGSLGFAVAYHSRHNTSMTYPVLGPPITLSDVCCNKL